MVCFMLKFVKRVWWLLFIKKKTFFIKGLTNCHEIEIPIKKLLTIFLLSIFFVAKSFLCDNKQINIFGSSIHNQKKNFDIFLVNFFHRTQNANTKAETKIDFIKKKKQIKSRNTHSSLIMVGSLENFFSPLLPTTLPSAGINNVNQHVQQQQQEEKTWRPKLGFSF